MSKGQQKQILPLRNATKGFVVSTMKADSIISKWDRATQAVTQVWKARKRFGGIPAAAQFVHFVFAQLCDVVIFQVIQRTFGFMVLVIVKGIVFFIAKWKSHDILMFKDDITHQR